MAAGNDSGTKAERDTAARLRAVEPRHIDRDPEGQRREVGDILRRKGLKGDVLQQATQALTAGRDVWIDLMMQAFPAPCPHRRPRL